MYEASTIVRSFNSAKTLIDTIESLRAQSVAVEIIVVDSGSTDSTLAIARNAADTVIEIDRADFTYGHALNVGARAASSSVHIAVSSHCVLPRADWVEITKQYFCDERVVAAVGAEICARGYNLEAPFLADHNYLVNHPWWGMSNHASGWSAAAWRMQPFDEQLIACEDKEWSMRATRTGSLLVADPRLIVSVAHRRLQGSRAYIRRVKKEVVAISEFSDVPEFDLRTAAQDFCRSVPSDPFITNGRAMGRTRLLDCIARWQGNRAIGVNSK
jgi:rhamnosyltransferase